MVFRWTLEVLFFCRCQGLPYVRSMAIYKLQSCRAPTLMLQYRSTAEERTAARASSWAVYQDPQICSRVLRAQKDHINIRILEHSISGLKTGLGTRM